MLAYFPQSSAKRKRMFGEAANRGGQMAMRRRRMVFIQYDLL
jgi:hypothetical protein